MGKPRITIEEASERLGKTAPAVLKQLRRHGIRKGPRGDYDAAEVFRAAKLGAEMDRAQLVEESGGAGGGDSLMEQKLREQIRKLTADADTAEFRLAQLRGEHVALSEHRERVSAVARAFRQAVDIWIATTAAEVGRADIKAKLEDGRRKAYAAIETEWSATDAQ